MEYFWEERSKNEQNIKAQKYPICDQHKFLSSIDLKFASNLS